MLSPTVMSIGELEYYTCLRIPYQGSKGHGIFRSMNDILITGGAVRYDPGPQHPGDNPHHPTAAGHLWRHPG